MMNDTPMLKDALKVGEIVTVKIKKAFEPQDGDYGKSQFAFVVFNGTDYRHYFKEKDLDIVVEGAELQGLVESYKGSPYVKWSKSGASKMPSNDEIEEIMNRSDEPRMDTRDTPAPVKTSAPDWDAIAEGKVRHGVAVAFIEAFKVRKLDEEMIGDMDEYVRWIMDGE